MRKGFIGDAGTCVAEGEKGEGVSGDQYESVRAAAGDREEEMVVVVAGSGKVERRGRGGSGGWIVKGEERGRRIAMAAVRSLKGRGYVRL